MNPTTHAAETVDRLRQKLRGSDGCRFVERDEFCSLLVSSQKWLRSDDLRLGVRGLLDPKSRVRILIEEEKLFASESEDEQPAEC
jgi:hypothetical protein